MYYQRSRLFSGTYISVVSHRKCRYRWSGESCESRGNDSRSCVVKSTSDVQPVDGRGDVESDAERQQLLHFPVSDAGVGPGWVSQGWEGVKAGVPPLSLSAALSLYLRSQNNIHDAVGASGTGPAPRTSPRPGQTHVQITLTGIAQIFLSWLFF